jgi:GTPase SAR1 family protein
MGPGLTAPSVPDLLSEVRDTIASWPPQIARFLDAGKLAGVESRLKRAFRLGVVGQFRSGKSSVMNALVGEKVAFVDEQEATPLLCRYYHAQKLEASRVLRDGTRQAEDPQTLLADMDRHRHDRAWLAELAYLEFGAPSPVLSQVEFWDTPGLGGSEHNREIAEDFVTHVEAALWVFDVDTIGRADIAGAMEVLALREVPVIGVLNKAEDLDPADIERAADFVRKVYPRIQFAEIVPLSARKALAHLGMGEVQPSFGTATGPDGGLGGLRQALDRLILANPSQVNEHAAARDLLALLDGFGDQIQVARTRLQGARQLFDLIYGEVEAKVGEKYAEIRDRLKAAYRTPLRRAIQASVHAAVEKAKPEDFANAERFRRLRDGAVAVDVAEPVLRRVSEDQTDHVHATVTSFALDIEQAIECHLSPLERAEVRARWTEGGTDDVGTRILGAKDVALAAALGVRKWDLLIPRPQWEFVLQDIRPFRRPTRPPGAPAATGPNTEEPGKRDPAAIAERSAKAYMAEGEPLLDDEVRLAVERSCVFALNIFRERLADTLLGGIDPDDVDRLLPMFDEVGGQLARWADTAAMLGPPPAALPDSLSHALEFQAGKRDALEEFWSAIAALPARVFEIRDPSFSHVSFPRLEKLDPYRPIRLRVQTEPLSATMAERFRQAVEALRATRIGAVTVWAVLDAPASDDQPELILGSHVLQFSCPISRALEGGTPFQVTAKPNEAKPWSAPAGYRVVAL